MSNETLSRRSLIAGGACAAALVGATAAGSTTPRALADSAPDFQAIVDGLESDEQECCTVYEDGSGILVDTNPHDKDGGDWTYSIAGGSAIAAIFDELGLPQIMLDMFNQCSASDGWQSRVRKNLELTWKYHPDTGLRLFIEWLE